MCYTCGGAGFTKGLSHCFWIAACDVEGLTVVEPWWGWLAAHRVSLTHPSTEATNHETRGKLQWIVAQWLLSSLTIPGFS